MGMGRYGKVWCLYLYIVAVRSTTTSWYGGEMVNFFLFDGGRGESGLQFSTGKMENLSVSVARR